LAIHLEQEHVFEAKLTEIQAKYAKRPGLLSRIEESGLG
jgi:hypothetical protein